MSIVITNGVATGRNVPKLSPDGVYGVAGNGDCYAFSTAAPLSETLIARPTPAEALYGLGFISPATPHLFYAMQFASISVGALYSFDGDSAWAPTLIGTGAYPGNAMGASNGHWWSLTPAGPLVDGALYTPAFGQSGWVQDGVFAVYQKSDFSALILERTDTHAAIVIAPPAGLPFIDNDYAVFAQGTTSAYVAFTAGGFSWVYTSATGTYTKVNLTALLAAGLNESTAQVLVVSGTPYICTWYPGGLLCFLRPLGADVCVTLNMPGSFMQLQGRSF